MPPRFLGRRDAAKDCLQLDRVFDLPGADRERQDPPRHLERLAGFIMRAVGPGEHRHEIAGPIVRQFAGQSSLGHCLAGIVERGAP